jgi:hypothetical protein
MCTNRVGSRTASWALTGSGPGAATAKTVGSASATPSARIALEQGAQITWVQKQLGHSSIVLMVAA